jgi:hypothetical protein
MANLLPLVIPLFLGLFSGKQVAQVSVATAKAASRWALNRRAVAKAFSLHKRIAGAAVSAGLAGVAKDVSRDRISTCFCIF